MKFKDYDNFHHLLCETVDKYANDSAYRWFDNNANETSLSWQEFYDQVKKVAKSLIALEMNKADKINILGYTSYKWVLTDIAGMSVGIATVGINQIWHLTVTILLIIQTLLSFLQKIRFS